MSTPRALALCLLLPLAACLTRLPARPAVAPEPVFDPARFFAGHTHGEGTLDVRVGHDRTLTVEGTGRTEADGTFRLDQTVTYGDGSTESRVWRLRDAGGGRYTATLSDAKGTVTAEREGTRFHLRYLLRHPAVYMEQWLYLEPDGRTVRNFAQVTVLGVPWARLSETITRADST